MFNTAMTLHEISENFSPRNFTNLGVPIQLIGICMDINQRRMGDQVFPPDNLYWYITNCAICDDCWDAEDANPAANFTNAMYIMSVIATNTYEIFCKDPSILEYIKVNNPNVLDAIKVDLLEMKKDNINILSSSWPGVDTIYRQFFGIPIYLDGIVSREHYEMFHSRYMTDAIAGHPMASNGWMREAMDDMEEMGVF